MHLSAVAQATSTEAWIYRNRASREAIVSFRGTSDPQDMMTDACMALAAFSPGDRPDSRSPEEVADSLSQAELEQGPLGGIFKSIKVTGFAVTHTPVSVFERGQASLCRWTSLREESQKHIQQPVETNTGQICPSRQMAFRA